MYNRSKILALVVICLLPLSLAVSFTPQQQIEEHATFKVASWSFPDEYGQGIDTFYAYQTIDGVLTSLTPFGRYYSSSSESTFNLTASSLNGENVTIDVLLWLNNTLVGASNFNDGKNYITIIANIYQVNELIETKTNFTYVSGSDSLDPMFYYRYSSGKFNFIPISGATFHAEITLKIFYAGA